MGSYLAAANKHIEDICAQIRGEERLAGADDLRIAVRGELLFYIFRFCAAAHDVGQLAHQMLGT